MRRLKLADFVALYRGKTISEAELVAVSAESSLVGKFVAELLGEPKQQPNDASGERPARVLEAVSDE
jgi:hypothetical protein